MRLFFSVQPVQEISAEENSNCAKSREDNRKRKTDLPKQLEWQSAVIPYSKIHPFIQNNSTDKFHTDYKNNTP